MTATTLSPAEVAEQPVEKKSRKKLFLVLVVVLLLAGGAAWFLMIRPGDKAPQPGEVAPLEAIQINLADGHYLRLGMALQLTADAHEVDGSKALDAAIQVFSGKPVAAVTSPENREKMRHELEEMLHERYHDEVMGVYFTEFVTQ